jgi:hypothetical protein
MSRLERVESFLNKHIRALGAIIVVCGFSIRVYYASRFYLNPDEAMHYTLALHPWHGIAGFYFNATQVLHPPLFIAILQFVTLFGHSEVLLRLVPAICGALFPWFVMLWVQRIADNCAALCAQLMLTFSLLLIDLGTEVRGYTLAFLFLSVSLLFLEKSLDSGSKRFMFWSSIFLYPAILSEYSVAWFVVAAGIYGILRLWKRRASGRLFLVWGGGQLLALGLYLFLYRTHIARTPFRGIQDMYTTWLQLGFPQPHEGILRFAVSGTLEQFRYMFQLRALSLAGAVFFLFGLYRLWTRKSPFHALLMVIPFCFAYLAAIFHLFPYGPSRHTAVLDISIAATVGTALAYFARHRILPIAVAALPCVLIWITLSASRATILESYTGIARSRHQLRDMQEAAAFLQQSVRPDALILTDGGTDLMLGYYLGCPDVGYFDSGEPYRIRQCRNLHLVIDPSFQFDGPSDVRAALSHVKSKYGPEQTIWIAAGGFGSRLSVANPVSDSRPFGQAIAIFRESDLPLQLAKDM